MKDRIPDWRIGHQIDRFSLWFKENIINWIFGKNILVANDERADRTDRTVCTDRTDRTDCTDCTDCTDSTDRTDRTDRTDCTDRTDRTDLTDSTDRTDHTDRKDTELSKIWEFLRKWKFCINKKYININYSNIFYRANKFFHILPFCNSFKTSSELNSFKLGINNFSK